MTSVLILSPPESSSGWEVETRAWDPVWWSRGPRQHTACAPDGVPVHTSTAVYQRTTPLVLKDMPRVSRALWATGR
jgi:hypothetical protein